MPYVNVKVAGALTKAQKENLSKGITDVIEKVTAKPPSYTYIVIEEVDRENWAIGGTLLADR